MEADLRFFLIEPEKDGIPIPMPPRVDGNTPDGFKLAEGRSIVVLGANGAGKTRLAGWLDRELKEQALYIPARRNISMPHTYSILSESSQLQQIIGNASWGSPQPIHEMKNHRYAQENAF